MAELNTGDGGGKKGSKKVRSKKSKFESGFNRNGGFGFLTNYILYAYNHLV